jgi:hypothetical protein
MSRPAVRPVCWVLFAIVYGAATSWVPSPADRSFWISNASAPYLILPFLVGAAYRGGSWAVPVALGVLAGWATIAGFAARELYDPSALANNRRLGLPAFSAGHLADWVVTTVSIYRLWLVLAVPAGVVFALMGQRWRQTGSCRLACAPAAALVLEPLAHQVVTTFGTMPAAYWVGEVGCGVLLLACLQLAAGRRRLT